MFGFLFGSALGAAALAGWPIYLHLRRRRRMKVQSVPSLRLFGFTKRKTRRIRIQQLALLVMRVTFVLAIALLLAQPFVSVSKYLPLPPVAGEKRDNLVLAIVLDDGLSSMHGNSTRTRLDESKAVLKRIIGSLPSNGNVSFALTSSPFAGPLLRRDEALAYLKKISSIPRPGEAVEAVKSVVRTFAGKQVCIVISAPRANDLWYSHEKAFEKAGGLGVYLHDLDPIRTTEMIRRIDHNSIRLQGKPGDLQAKSFTISGAEGIVVRRTITAHEALIGEVSLPSTDDERFLKVTVGDATHPWHTYYHRPQAHASSKKRVVILRRTNEAGVAMDKIVTSLLLACGVELVIDHLNPETEPLPEHADAVVAVEGMEAIATVKEWLVRGGGGHATVLLVPPAPADHGWNAPVNTHPSQAPTKIVDTQGLPIDELAVLEIRNMRPERLTEPMVGKTVLATADGLAIRTREVRPKGGDLWRLGIEVNTSEPAVFHPSFPVLLASIMLPKTSDVKDKDVTVGDVVRVDEWFGSDLSSGEVTLPNGEIVQVQLGMANSTFVRVNDPGVYVMSTSGTQRYRVANVPRDPSTTSLSMEEITTLLGEPKITVIDGKSRITPEDFQQMETVESQRSVRKKRRDLSPIVFIFALVSLSVEALLLYLVWRRKASIAE